MANVRIFQYLTKYSPLFLKSISKRKAEIPLPYPSILPSYHSRFIFSSLHKTLHDNNVVNPQSRIFPGKRYLSTTSPLRNDLQQELLRFIAKKDWSNKIFNQAGVAESLVSLYRTQQIDDNVLLILNTRQYAAQYFYQKTIGASEIVIRDITTHLNLVLDYFNHPDHDYRLRFIKQILQDEHAVKLFKIFLEDKLKKNTGNTLYFFHYRLSQDNFSEFLKIILQNDDKYTQHDAPYKNTGCAHMFFPVPETRDEKTGIKYYSGIIPSLHLAQYIYDSLSEFMRIKTGNPDFMAVQLKLSIRALSAKDLASLHCDIQHSVGIETDKNSTQQADGYDTTPVCFSVFHDIGFHAFRLCLQPGFKWAATLVNNTFYPFYISRQYTHPKEYDAFEKVTLPQHSGKLAQVLTDQEKVILTTNTLESLYGGLFEPIIQGPYPALDRYYVIHTFNLSLTTDLFKEMIKDSFKILKAEDFSRLIQIILSKNAFNSYIASNNPSRRNLMQLAVIAILKQLICETTGSDFSEKLQEELILFRDEAIYDQKMNIDVRKMYCNTSSVNLLYNNYTDFFDNEKIVESTAPRPQSEKIAVKI